MNEINTTEIKYVNSEDSLVEVSFSLPGRDWYELSRSRCWRAVESFLRRKKSTNSQKRRITEEGWLHEPSDYFTDHDFERKQLEELLLKIIERESDDAATPTGLVGVACIARTLMDLWKS